MNVAIRSEELSGNFPARLKPVFRELGGRYFSFWDGAHVVVEGSRHSVEKRSRVNFRGEKGGILGRTFCELTIKKLALLELRGAKIASRERTAIERDVAKKSSSEHAPFESTVLELRR